MYHIALKCRCQNPAWELHLEKIICTKCKFTEHFGLHETIEDIITRLKIQGSYFLANDSDKLKNGLVVQLTTGYNYH